MMFHRIFDDRYRKEETFEAAFTITEDHGQHNVKAVGMQYAIRPTDVILRWDRYLGTGWRRDSSTSRINGRRILKSGGLGSQPGFQFVFSNHLSFTNYAASIPELVELVEHIEKTRLPQ